MVDWVDPTRSKQRALTRITRVRNEPAQAFNSFFIFLYHRRKKWCPFLFCSCQSIRNLLERIKGEIRRRGRHLKFWLCFVLCLSVLGLGDIWKWINGQACIPIILSCMLSVVLKYLGCEQKNKRVIYGFENAEYVLEMGQVHVEVIQCSACILSK